MRSIVKRTSAQLSTKGRKRPGARRQPILPALEPFHVAVPDPGQVSAYLNTHSKLRCLLIDMVKKTRAEFGADAQLTLLVYRDPELEDRYLTLYVRAATYGPDVMDRIEAVSRVFHSRLARISGHILLTTDFAPVEPTCPSNGRPS